MKIKEVFFSKNKILITILVLAVLGVAVFWFVSRNDIPEAENPSYDTESTLDTDKTEVEIDKVEQSNKQDAYQSNHGAESDIGENTPILDELREELANGKGSGGGGGTTDNTDV